MKRERRLTVFGIIINSLVTFLKIYAGMVFNSYTLMVSGYYTLCNMSQDFLAYSGSVARGRRASRTEAFGYGKWPLLSLVFYGLIILFLGLFVFIKSFGLNYVRTDLRILFIILIVLVSLVMFARNLFKNAKDIQSEMLMDMAHYTAYDFYLSLVSIIFIAISSFIPVFDMFGSLYLSLMIMLKSVNVMLNAFVMLNGQNDQNKKIIKAVEKIINEGDGIYYSNSNLVNVKNFYKISIEVLVDDNVNLTDLILWEYHLMEKIRVNRLHISMVEFLIYKR